MRRSWSRRRTPLKLWFGCLGVAAGVAFWWHSSVKNAEPFKDVRPLDLSAYMERPASIRGSSFSLRGTVHQTLASSVEAGRLILVMTLAARDNPEPPEPLPLQVPADLLSRMQIGRQFIFKVLVGEAGVLLVQDAAEL